MCVVKIDSGLVRGKQEKGYVSFKGIPYAAPPVGQLRWKHPQPVEPWEGVRDALTLGRPCCQAPSQCVPGGDPDDRGVHDEGTEDCLYINVFTPDVKGEKLPVFLWIHGGAFCCGSGGGQAAIPDTFVSRGIVYVSFNYRVGLMGFFAHPELSAENEHHVSGNYAHYDQLAALEWVRRNIASFGGDPENITVGGCSAGAGSTSVLACSPLARGMMRRAIVLSSLGINSASEPEEHKISTMEEAEQRGVEFMERHGAKSLAELRAMSYEQLIDLPDTSFRRYFHYGTTIGTCKDGFLLPEYSKIANERLENDNIPYIGLVTHDEGAGHVLKRGVDVFVWQSRGVYGDRADEYLSLCDLSSTEAALDCANRTHLKLAGTKVFAEMSAKAGKEPVYVVDFTHKDPVRKTAYHGLVTKYFSGNYTKLPGWDETDAETARVTQEYFCNFIKTGDPNGDGLPEWTPYSAENRKVLYLSEKPQVLDDAVAEDPLNRWAREFLERKLNV